MIDPGFISQKESELVTVMIKSQLIRLKAACTHKKHEVMDEDTQKKQAEREAYLLPRPSDAKRRKEGILEVQSYRKNQAQFCRINLLELPLDLRKRLVSSLDSTALIVFNSTHVSI